MRLSEYFGMEVCYSTLKMKEHVFHHLAEIFFFSNGELLKITLHFHKNCQNICQNDVVFLPNIHIRLVYLLCDEEFWALSNFPRKISKFPKLRKWRRFFWKFWKWIFSKRPSGNFFIFFGRLSIIWTTYAPSLASGKRFFPIEKNIFQKKIKILRFLQWVIGNHLSWVQL